MEEALAKVHKSFVSAGLKKASNQLTTKLEESLKSLKKHLLKDFSKGNLKSLKDFLPEVATLLKDAKNHHKELTQKSNMAVTQASSSKR